MNCPHMNQVVQNAKIGDAVLRECQAVRYLIRNAEFTDKILRTMRCMECGEINCGSNFMCLQCGFCGCWNNKHFLHHSKEVGHIFGVNASNGLLFCFRCGDYMADLITEVPVSSWNIVMERTKLPSSERRDGLQGLVNMGSTCFMSSIVQAVMHNPYFNRYFLTHSHYNNCNIKSGELCVSCAFDEIACDFYGTPGKNMISKGFINLLSSSWNLNQNFVGSMQQDAHEFWQFLLNQFHSDNKPTHGSSKNEDCQCITHMSFRGILKNSLQCLHCGYTKTTFDPIMDLSLEIKNISTLNECISHFQREEELVDSHYECESCKQRKGVIKRLNLHKCPNVLVFQLKRFEHLMNGQSIKLNNKVAFPCLLNLKSHLTRSDDLDQNDVPNITYDLLSVVSHHGTVDQGHYTCVCRTDDDQWFKFNDSMVTAISEEQVLQEQAYLLFYIIR